MDWQRMIELEPDLGQLEANILAGLDTLSGIMLRDALTLLVGPFAWHPRLRNSEAYAVVYQRLTEADKQRREAWVVADKLGAAS